jgi:hypothetical protein
VRGVLIREHPIPLLEQVPEPLAEGTLSAADKALEAGLPIIPLAVVEKVLPYVGVNEAVLAKAHGVFERERCILKQRVETHPFIFIQRFSLSMARCHDASDLGIPGNLNVVYPPLLQRLMVGGISYRNGVLRDLASILADL